jgi:hypothetical protein
LTRIGTVIFRKEVSFCNETRRLEIEAQTAQEYWNAEYLAFSDITYSQLLSELRAIASRFVGTVSVLPRGLG